jgi:uncharacterized lipoprotein
MLRYMKWLLALTSLATICSCAHVYGDRGVIKNRENDYLKAESIPPLKLPPGYAGTSLQENYPVPVKTYPAADKRADVLPPELNSLKK